MREAASRGFWITSHAPFGYNRIMAQDGPKKRPTLEIDPDASRIVRRMFDMAEAGNGTLEIIRTLNNEGIASPRGELWGRTSVHGILTNEAYTGTMLWGVNAKDQAEPVRVEKAFPAIVSKAQFRRVGKHLSSRAPKFSHPRRVGSSYLLSGLVKCQACNTPLTGQFAKSGQYSYYVCQSNIKLGNGACKTPRLNARHFEEMVVAKIRSNILTEGSIRDLVKVVDEEMDGAADVAETTYTPFQTKPDAAPVRLIVRRVKPTPGSQLALFARYSYHAFITDRDGETLELEADHRRHAEVENAIRDLKYGVGLNHMPSARFAANGADWSGRADRDHQDPQAAGLRSGGTDHPLGAPPHFASPPALALGNPVQSRLGPAASHSIPGLTASLQLTQRPRKLAPPQVARVPCCVSSRHSRASQLPHRALRALCGA